MSGNIKKFFWFFFLARELCKNSWQSRFGPWVVAVTGFSLTGSWVTSRWFCLPTFHFSNEEAEIQRGDAVSANKSRPQGARLQVRDVPSTQHCFLLIHTQSMIFFLRLWHISLCMWLHFIHTKYIESQEGTNLYWGPTTCQALDLI